MMNRILTTLSDNNSNDLDKLPEAIRWILPSVIKHFSDINKVKRDNDKVEKDLWKRKIDDVVNSWETFYMRCCVDYSLSFLEKMKKTIPNERLFLGIEKLRINSSEDIHLYVEIKNNWETIIVDFARENLIYIYFWEYKNSRPDAVKTISTYSIPSWYFDGSDSVISIANKIWEWKNIEKFLGNMNNLKKINTEKRFQNFEKRMSNKIKINVEWEWYEIETNTRNKDVSEWLYSVLSM